MNFVRFESLKFRGFYPKSILDIGAHKGVVAIQMKELWPDASIFLIEANPLLEKELKTLGLPFKICLLGEENKATVTYYMSHVWLGSSGNSIYREISEDYTDENLHTLRLPMFRLDDILEDKNFDLIKIDTQGSELDILKGGKETLNHAKCVIIECSVISRNQHGAKVHDVFSFMNQNNFFMTDIIDMAYDGDTLQHLDLLFERNL